MVFSLNLDLESYCKATFSLYFFVPCEMPYKSIKNINLREAEQHSFILNTGHLWSYYPNNSFGKREMSGQM